MQGASIAGRFDRLVNQVKAVTGSPIALLGCWNSVLTMDMILNFQRLSPNGLQVQGWEIRFFPNTVARAPTTQAWSMPSALALNSDDV